MPLFILVLLIVLIAATLASVITWLITKSHYEAQSGGSGGGGGPCPPAFESIVLVPGGEKQSQTTYAVGDVLTYDLNFTEPVNIIGVLPLHVLGTWGALFDNQEMINDNKTMRFTALVVTPGDGSVAAGPGAVVKSLDDPSLTLSTQSMILANAIDAPAPSFDTIDVLSVLAEGNGVQSNDLPSACGEDGNVSVLVGDPVTDETLNCVTLPAGGSAFDPAVELSSIWTTNDYYKIISAGGQDVAAMHENMPTSVGTTLRVSNDQGTTFGAGTQYPTLPATLSESASVGSGVVLAVSDNGKSARGNNNGTTGWTNVSDYATGASAQSGLAITGTGVLGTAVVAYQDASFVHVVSTTDAGFSWTTPLTVTTSATTSTIGGGSVKVVTVRGVVVIFFIDADDKVSYAVYDPAHDTITTTYLAVDVTIAASDGFSTCSTSDGSIVVALVDSSTFNTNLYLLILDGTNTSLLPLIDTREDVSPYTTRIGSSCSPAGTKQLYFFHRNNVPTLELQDESCLLHAHEDEEEHEACRKRSVASTALTAVARGVNCISVTLS